MLQIHLLRDELETVGDRAAELRAKLIDKLCDDVGPAEMQWIERLVEEAIAAQQRLLSVIENSGIDWQVDEHEQKLDDDESEEEAGEEESEDEGGVIVGRYGNMEVVADEDVEDEEGAERFDGDEYRKAMAALRRGKMMQDDLQGVDHY